MLNLLFILMKTTQKRNTITDYMQNLKPIINDLSLIGQSSK